jgi:hypothetical protein
MGAVTAGGSASSRALVQHFAGGGLHTHRSIESTMSIAFHRAALAAAVFSSPVPAQGPVFQTPGMPQVPANYASQGTADSGQTNRFSSVFNPAFSFVVDFLADYENPSGASDDGVELDMRALELGAQSWVDPDAWAYFVAATDGESLNVEEAAVHYVGLGGHDTIRAGRFFVDFGKQMQTHVHELRTVDRPLVLRTFLGDEVKGDGVQWDSWTTAGDNAAVRWSIGVFGNLLPEESDDFDSAAQAEASIADRKDPEDLNFTARLTGFTDVGQNGVLQLGASARALPSYAFTFEPSGSVADDLSNTVFGVDATYGWTSDSGLSGWTVGGEYLFDTGDTFASIDDSGTPADPTDDVVGASSDDLHGFYLFVDWAWDKSHSVGVQYSQVELPETDTPDASEITAYYTRMFSEYHRLRFAATGFDRDDGEDAVGFAVQYTAFVGAHGHGVNW